MHTYCLVILAALFMGLLRPCPHLTIHQESPKPNDVVRDRSTIADSSFVVRAQGGYKGLLILGDYPGTYHGDEMKKMLMGNSRGYSVASDIKIPEENIVFVRGFGERDGDDNKGLRRLNSGDYESIRLAASVAHIPFDIPFVGSGDVSHIARNTILFVTAAGNTELVRNRRDLWSEQHPFWQGGARHYYRAALASFKTGKVIAATSATETKEGDIVPLRRVVQCGDIAEWCFTVLPEAYTSDASARLAAMSFYLAQLYPTAEEIVETLNACAIDIGRPGIDREFGRGLANISCEPVILKEYEAIRRTLHTTVYSPALERIMKKEEKDDCACFSIFSKFSREMGIGVGHIGMSFSGKNNTMTLLAGRTFSPIGVSSSLYHETNRFAEIGFRRPLFDVKGNKGSLIAVHSTQWGDLSANISRIGMLYEKSTERYQAGIYAGYRHVRISAGLPGFRDAGASRVSLTRGSWEMRFSLSVGM